MSSVLLEACGYAEVAKVDKGVANALAVSPVHGQVEEVLKPALRGACGSYGAYCPAKPRESIAQSTSCEVQRQGIFLIITVRTDLAHEWSPGCQHGRGHCQSSTLSLSCGFSLSESSTSSLVEPFESFQPCVRVLRTFGAL